MKTIVKFLATIAIFAAATLNSNAQEIKEGSITVKISGIKNNNGTIMVGLGKDYRISPEKMTGKKTDAKTDGVSLTLEKIPYGEYKIYIFHDENGNFILDRSEKGIPQEGIGILKGTQVWEIPVTIGDKIETIECSIWYMNDTNVKFAK